MNEETTAPEEVHEETTGQKVGMWIAILTVLFPSMIVSGFTPDWNVLPLWMWISISAAGAGIGMAIGYRPMLAALLGGATGGACIPLALIGYVIVRVMLTETFINLELLIPALIGALPGIAVYKTVAWALGHEPESDEAADSINSTDI